jgi:hypothetical protein
VRLKREKVLSRNRMMLKKRNSYSKMKDSREEDSSNLRATANSKHPNTQTDNDSIDQQTDIQL